MMDLNQIKQLIPHRYPFLLIDSVLELAEGKKCTTLKNLSANEEFFQGHFPAMPIMPGVLIIEALAQTAALIGGKRKKGELFMIVGVDKFKFQAQVIPGDQIICTAEILKFKLNMFFLNAKAIVRKPDGTNQPCASGVLKCAKVDTIK